VTGYTQRPLFTPSITRQGKPRLTCYAAADENECEKQRLHRHHEQMHPAVTAFARFTAPDERRRLTSGPKGFGAGQPTRLED
jgi:hypothetical protein